MQRQREAEGEWPCSQYSNPDETFWTSIVHPASELDIPTSVPVPDFHHPAPMVPIASGDVPQSYPSFSTLGNSISPRSSQHPYDPRQPLGPDYPAFWQTPLMAPSYTGPYPTFPNQLPYGIDQTALVGMDLSHHNNLISGDYGTSEGGLTGANMFYGSASTAIKTKPGNPPLVDGTSGVYFYPGFNSPELSYGRQDINGSWSSGNQTSGGADFQGWTPSEGLTIQDNLNGLYHLTPRLPWQLEENNVSMAYQLEDTGVYHGGNVDADVETDVELSIRSFGMSPPRTAQMMGEKLSTPTETEGMTQQPSTAGESIPEGNTPNTPKLRNERHTANIVKILTALTDAGVMRSKEDAGYPCRGLSIHLLRQIAEDSYGVLTSDDTEPHHSSRIRGEDTVFIVRRQGTSLGVQVWYEKMDKSTMDWDSVVPLYIPRAKRKERVEPCESVSKWRRTDELTGLDPAQQETFIRGKNIEQLAKVMHKTYRAGSSKRSREGFLF